MHYQFMNGNQVSYMIVLLKTHEFYTYNLLYLDFCDIISDKNRKWKVHSLMQLIWRNI